MRIAEIFRSIQGEGRLTGTESIFVRTSGCNLRCRYCDTPYASWTPEGEDLSVAEILGRIDELTAEREVSPLPLGEGQGVRAAALTSWRTHRSWNAIALTLTLSQRERGPASNTSFSPAASRCCWPN